MFVYCCLYVLCIVYGVLYVLLLYCCFVVIGWVIIVGLLIGLI
nr:MAG TPA: hypothetical protein [Caudoviricetes sp.]